MELNDILVKRGIDPQSVLVFRHRPTEPELRKILPWLAAEKPRVYNAYQQTQTPRVEKAMQKAQYVASFIGHEPGKALFVGLYKRGKSRPLTRTTCWKIPENVELRKFGAMNWDENRPFVLWFELDLTDVCTEWKGRLVLAWPPPDRSWWRWSVKNECRIDAVLRENILDAEMPAWDRLVLTWVELKAIPRSWESRLREWRGIYFIFDVSDGKGYVGSACGSDNIHGRWLNYRKSGHGGNKELRSRDPANFRFSILQSVSPAMDRDAVIQLEHAWMDRLNTRTCGLND